MIVGAPAPAHCPFCGSCDTSLSRVTGQTYTTSIKCRICKAEGPRVNGASDRMAIEAWNERVTQTVEPKE